MNEPKKRGRPSKAEIAAREAAPASEAQDYAMRVWSGQSIDLPRNERVRRVKAALEVQGFPFEGVQLP